LTDISQESRADKKDEPPSAYAISFPQAILWGVLGCVTSFGLSLTAERTAGTLVRLSVAPIHRWQILAGKGVACFITTVVMATALLIFGRIVYHIRPVSLPNLAIAVVCIGIGFVGVMMLLAVIGRTAAASAGVGRAVLLMLAMIGGGSIPIFFMPQWMQTASSVSPFKWAVLALDGAIWRGFSFSEMAFPCGILLAIGVLGFAIGSQLFRWEAQA
jgi:ABC-2 type transport system permease protein